MENKERRWPEWKIWTIEHYKNVTNFSDRQNREIDIINWILWKELISILDVPCWFWRISIPLSERHNVTGMDINEDFIKIAKNDAKEIWNWKVQFIHWDMRNLNFKYGSFDAIINIFSSFWYFIDKSEDEKFIKESYRIMKKWGKLIMDLPNPYNKLASFKEHFISTYWNDVKIEHFAKFDPIENAIITKRKYEWENGKIEHGEMFMRLYTPTELINIANKYWFKVTDLLDKDWNEYSLNSWRYRIVFTK